MTALSTDPVKQHSHGFATGGDAPATTRAATVRSFDPEDFPAINGREEEWRFTPVKKLKALLDAAITPSSVRWPARSHDPLPDGVTVENLARDDDRLGSVLTPFDRLSALAYDGFEAATVITVVRGATPAEPVMVRVDGGPPDTVAYGHTFVDVGELAEATVVLEQTGGGQLADNVEVRVGNGAHLKLVTVADWAPGAVQAQHVKFRLGRDARVTHVAVSLGGDLVRQFTSVSFADSGAEIDAYGVYFAGDGQHLEHRLFVEHSQPDCRSNVVYRGALQGAKSHTVWVGDVLIKAEATGTDTYEINRNLILTDGARADSVPNLEIETGEITGAGHASATGRFDDEQLFYLQSRGIPADVARRLVVRGFFAELLEKIGVSQVEERLSSAIDQRLSEVGA